MKPEAIVENFSYNDSTTGHVFKNREFVYQSSMEPNAVARGTALIFLMHFVIRKNVPYNPQ